MATKMKKDELWKALTTPVPKDRSCECCKHFILHKTTHGTNCQRVIANEPTSCWNPADQLRRDQKVDYKKSYWEQK